MSGSSLSETPFPKLDSGCNVSWSSVVFFSSVSSRRVDGGAARQVDSEDEDDQEEEDDVDSDDELLAGLDADPEVGANFPLPAIAPSSLLLLLLLY